jgi:hypothetical protein
MRIWFDMASQAAEACQAWAGGAASPETFRRDRTSLYKIWGDYWEQFLRSASFLEGQQRCQSGSLKLHEQAREYLAWLHREFQLPSSQDIDQLMIAVRRIGEDLGEHFEQVDVRLESIAARLESLAARLGALEKKVRGTNSSAPAERIDETETV